MLWKIIMILLIIILVIWAVRTRVNIKRKRGVLNADSTIASPASLALGELVAIAGGIYLSLMLIAQFLDISLPEKVNILNLSMDPLAFTAIIIALLQPFIYILFYKLFKH